MKVSGELRHTGITVLWDQGESPHPSTRHCWAQLLVGTEPSCPSPSGCHLPHLQQLFPGSLLGEIRGEKLRGVSMEQPRAKCSSAGRTGTCLSGTRWAGWYLSRKLLLPASSSCLCFHGQLPSRCRFVPPPRRPPPAPPHGHGNAPAAGAGPALPGKSKDAVFFPLCRLASGWLCWCRSPVGGRKGNTLNRDCSRAWGSPRLRVRCWELCFPHSFPTARPGAAQPPAPGSLLTLTHSHRPWC